MLYIAYDGYTYDTEDIEYQGPSLSVCVDCYHANANGTGGMDLTEEREREIIEGLNRFEGEVLLDNLYKSARFSMDPCNVCGTRLGGDRLSLAVTVL